MKSMDDYHDHYFKKDVLLLANVFEKFINTCLKFYKLDPCHYFSFPGLNWDAMLKMTCVRLENILDTDMYSFSEKLLRGGITYIAKRYSEANNKYVKNFDPTKPSNRQPYKLFKSIIQGTACGAMSGYLPYGEFKWLKNVENFDANSISEKGPVGYILEVDLQYPDKLHALHNDYSLAPEKLAIPYDMLSDYCKNYY